MRSYGRTDRPPGQFACAISLAVLAAMQAAILSTPLSFWYGLHHAPKSEFAGLAVFSQMVITDAFIAAIVLVSVFAVVFSSYNPGSPFYHRAARTLLVSIGCGIAAIVITAAFGGGPSWALALGSLALIVGVVYLVLGHSSELG